ncbi:major capsid protein [Microvirus mar26]|uniref:Major capsid protein n=2 Tax=unclassified Microviridae TaxID=117574 RepID=A0A8F5RCP9_9VIRU|nr:major capsid protein [Microvirus mar24]QXN75114.1 major capsid protein [Microvirus mar26]
MSNSNFNQIVNGNTNVHFSKAMFGENESSRMTATPVHLTTFNAGDLVPIYCREILPDESIDMSMDFVIRQTTLLAPTMGSMHVDIYAFFVPNRIVNQSWKALQGENISGSWTAPSVSLAPLVGSSSADSIQVPVGSVADYYGFPTQAPLPKSVLSRCHDLKFRGYVMIWNEWFRDQNYQPPIAMSTLNVYQGFFDSSVSAVAIDGANNPASLDTSRADGSFGAGAVKYSIYSSGDNSVSSSIGAASSGGRFRALSKPLKANKLHDYFTSVLPSPQKGQSVFAPASGQISSVPVITDADHSVIGSAPLRGYAGFPVNNPRSLFLGSATSGNSNVIADGSSGQSVTSSEGFVPTNLVTAPGAEVTGLGLSVDDIRMAAAIQQVYETLARGGSRYRSIISSFFGIDVDDPFSDIPECLGHISRDLDLYQTAQTSASQSGSTAQGNLAAFGYTSSGGHLFSHRFVEHGYLHVFAVVRHRNIYPSYMARDNFRMNMLDFYTPPLANISEQPVFAREVNPFAPNPNDAFGYQEPWAEYRFEPDQVSGYMRPGVDESLSLWNYADDFDSGLQIANGNWLKSNSQEVLDRTLAVTSSVSPQLKGQFLFKVDKTLPMPVYSVPGMDII